MISNLYSRFVKNKWYLLIFILALLALLSIYGVKGLYTRYAQDDYCYGYRLNQNGFFYNQIDSYLHLTEYSSDRYSLTLVYNIAELLGGPKFYPFVPALGILLLGFSLVYLALQIVKPTRQNLLLPILIGLIILFFTLYLSTNLYQILYWFSGMNTYFTPMVFIFFILGRIIHFSRTNKFTVWNALELGFLNFLAGGFSEITAVWQFSIWVFTLIWLFFFWRSTFFKNAKRPLITALISTLLAIVVLVVNPTNSIRGSHFGHLSYLSIVTHALYFGEEFIRVSVKATPLPFGIIFLLGFFLSAQFKPENAQNLKRSLWFFGSILATVYLLCVMVMFPTLYAMGSFPGERELLPALFTLVIGVFLTGWVLAGLILSTWVNLATAKTAKVFLFLLGFLLLLYVARTGPRVWENMDKFRARATAWDLRQQIILDEKAAGKSDIIIPLLDSVYGITEIEPDPGNWVNMCAAKYYDVKSITAEENYLGITTYPIGK